MRDVWVNSRAVRIVDSSIEMIAADDVHFNSMMMWAGLNVSRSGWAKLIFVLDLVNNLQDILRSNSSFEHVLIVIRLSLLEKTVFSELTQEMLWLLYRVVETKPHFLLSFILPQASRLLKLFLLCIDPLLLSIDMGHHPHTTVARVAGSNGLKSIFLGRVRLLWVVHSEFFPKSWSVFMSSAALNEWIVLIFIGYSSGKQLCLVEPR